MLRGTIERRLLVNYRVDPDLVAGILPAPFRPQIVAGTAGPGTAVAGICLIRLGGMRPRGLPASVGPVPVGVRSENAAHRIAVEWDTPAGVRSGVYIPRRDTNSLINRLVGGRLFPGEHHGATFRVTETSTDLHVAFAARDGSAEVDVRVRVTDELTGSAVFGDVDEASAFFEKGAVGFSATREPGRFDGLELRTTAWKVEPTEVISSRSSFFDDRERFPPGSAVLDSALLMRRVPVTWAPLPGSALPVLRRAAEVTHG